MACAKSSSDLIIIFHVYFTRWELWAETPVRHRSTAHWWPLSVAWCHAWHCPLCQVTGQSIMNETRKCHICFLEHKCVNYWLMTQTYVFLCSGYQMASIHQYQLQIDISFFTSKNFSNWTNRIGSAVMSYDCTHCIEYAMSHSSAKYSTGSSRQWMKLYLARNPAAKIRSDFPNLCWPRLSTI